MSESEYNESSDDLEDLLFETLDLSPSNEVTRMEYNSLIAWANEQSRISQSRDNG